MTLERVVQLKFSTRVELADSVLDDFIVAARRLEYATSRRRGARAMGSPRRIGEPWRCFSARRWRRWDAARTSSVSPGPPRPPDDTPRPL